MVWNRLVRLRSRPEALLMLMALAVPLSMGTWQALLNNFVIERASFTGAEIGILQSLREVPGFLAFTAVFVLLVLREQRFAVVAIAVLGLGTALTGFFPTVIGLYCTTVLMSVGFHYFETCQTSLSLQWLDRAQAPAVLGRLLAVGSIASLCAYGFVYLTVDLLALDYLWIYMTAGGATIAIGALAAGAFPRFESAAEQNKHLVLRRRYWLYYFLTFLAGARRQIFTVFAGFMMVEKFGYDAGAISLLFLVNGLVNIVLAPRIGALIGRWGERRALACEYLGLIGIFLAYAFVDNAALAAGLYIADHAFFSMAIAIKTYFQKIADPADIAPTAGVGFSINHIAAVVIPALFGFIWLVSPAAVFLAGAAIAFCSLVLSRFVPRLPEPGAEIHRPRLRPALSAE